MRNGFATDLKSEGRESAGVRFLTLLLINNSMTFKQFLTENIIRVNEDPYNRERRLRSGLTLIQVVDAKKIKDAYEKHHNEPLVHKPSRLEGLQGVKILDDYPKVTGPYIGPDESLRQAVTGIGIGDGRHRVAYAASIGAGIEVATNPEFPIPKEYLV
jgi:hypothetical protein